jgi:GTPase SAR1 family protein
MTDELYRIMLIGDTSTGKTSFLTQLIYHAPERIPKSTEQLSFFTMRITNPNAVLQIWDSPGDPKYHFQVVTPLQRFKTVLLFVDVTNDHTLIRARDIA